MKKVMAKGDEGYMQGVATNSKKEKNKFIHYLMLLVFSGVLYVGIYMGGYSLTQLNKFYEKKVQDLGGATISAYLPANQDYNKVMETLKSVEAVNEVDHRSSFFLENGVINVNHKQIDSNLLIQNASDNNSISSYHLVLKGNYGEEDTIYLPYLYHTYYHVKLGDSVSMGIGMDNRTFTVNGFYEDSIYANFKLADVTQVYVFDHTMNAIKETFQQGEEYITLYASTEESTASSETTEEFVDLLRKDIFVGGLTLECLNSSQVQNNVNVYIKIVQVSWLVIGALMILLSLFVSFYLWNRLLRKPMEGNSSISKGSVGIVITCILALIMNGSVGFFLLPKFMEYQISPSGFQLLSQNKIAFYIFSLILYLSFVIIVFLLSYVLSSQQRKVSGKREHNLIKGDKIRFVSAFKGQSIIMFFITLVLTIVLMFSTKVFDHTMIDRTQLREWLGLEETIEVFADGQDIENQDSIVTMTIEEVEQFSPMIYSIYYAIITIVVLMFIAQSLLMLESRNKRLNNTGSNDDSKKQYVIPMLSSFLVCMIPAMLMGFIVSEVFGNIIVKKVFVALGFAPFHFTMNIGYFIIMLFAVLLVTSGIVLLVMKDRKKY